MKPAILSFVITLLLGIFAWGFNVKYPDIAPVWGQLAMLIALAGLVITGLIVRRDWRHFLPVTSQGFPDFPIRDLFFYRDSDVCYAGDPNNPDPWLKVGRDILNKLSTGQLMAWGERDGSGGRLTPIKQDYWAGADLTYMFFGEGERYRELVHAVNKEYEQGSNYRDVQFNKSEALKVWPPRNDWDAPLVLSFLVPITLLSVMAVAMAYPQWKGIVFPPISRSIAIDSAYIEPYPRDKNYLQTGVVIKNTSGNFVQYKTAAYLIRVGLDIRHNGQGRREFLLAPLLSNTLTSAVFDIGSNAENNTLAGVDILIEYGPSDQPPERTISASFACDLIIGKNQRSECMILKLYDLER